MEERTAISLGSVWRLVNEKIVANFEKRISTLPRLLVFERLE